MSVGQCEDKLIGKQDVKNLAILIGIALAIGVYLIVTTVLISKDGVFYIERAQQLASDPIRIIKRHPPGYPFLIMAAHKCTTLFTDSTSVFTWIYAAQSVTLLCRLGALIPLYFIGKLLVGSKNSFWAILILIILPHSAKYCAEVLREWPYILFLAAGFFFLLWGAKSRNWWAFGLVGLCSGLGYLIRPESIQLIVYGFVWLVLCVIWSKLWNVPRWKILVALTLLFIGFAIPATPYMKCTGQIINPKIRTRVIKCFSFNSLPNTTDVPKINVVASNLNCNAAGIVPPNILKAFSELFESIGENLMWFFVLPLVIGLWYWLRGEAKFEEHFLMTFFISANIAMMILQYCYISSEVSRRWSLPLISVTIYYVPIGLQICGSWLGSRFHRTQKKNERNPQFWFFILLLVGVMICLPKLLRPLGIQKEGYRDAARWLRANTATMDVVATPDKRIAFYAECRTARIQTGRSTTSGGLLTSENWYHIVGSYDGKYQKLYVNGKLVATKNLIFEIINTGNDLVVGKPHTTSRSLFKGVVDEVRIYERALSIDEVTSLYNNHIRKVVNSGLIGYWTLDRNATGIDQKPDSAMRFNGTTDYINLLPPGSGLDVDAITVSIWVKSELPNQSKWCIGNDEQFRIGIINSKAYFWIRERSPGSEIPPEATYVVDLINGERNKASKRFNKKVEIISSTLVNKSTNKKVVIYKVL